MKNDDLNDWITTLKDWKDPQRQGVLKSVLISKQSNPTEYKSRILFWSNVCLKSSDFNKDRLLIDPSLLKGLVHEQNIPTIIVIKL
jgi:hypothetical protein